MKPIDLKIEKSTEPMNVASDPEAEPIMAEKLNPEDALVLTLTLWDGDDFLTETIEEDL